MVSGLNYSKCLRLMNSHIIILDRHVSHLTICVLHSHKCSFFSERGPLLEQNFFDHEIKMEGDICRDLVSLSPEDERRTYCILLYPNCFTILN